MPKINNTTNFYSPSLPSSEDAWAQLHKDLRARAEPVLRCIPGFEFPHIPALAECIANFFMSVPETVALREAGQFERELERLLKELSMDACADAFAYAHSFLERFNCDRREISFSCELVATIGSISSHEERDDVIARVDEWLHMHPDLKEKITIRELQQIVRFAAQFRKEDRATVLLTAVKSYTLSEMGKLGARMADIQEDSRMQALRDVMALFEPFQTHLDFRDLMSLLLHDDYKKIQPAMRATRDFLYLLRNHKKLPKFIQIDSLVLFFASLKKANGKMKYTLSFADHVLRIDNLPPDFDLCKIMNDIRLAKFLDLERFKILLDSSVHFIASVDSNLRMQMNISVLLDAIRTLVIQKEHRVLADCIPLVNKLARNPSMKELIAELKGIPSAPFKFVYQFFFLGSNMWQKNTSIAGIWKECAHLLLCAFLLPEKQRVETLEQISPYLEKICTERKVDFESLLDAFRGVTARDRAVVMERSLRLLTALNTIDTQPNFDDYRKLMHNLSQVSTNVVMLTQQLLGACHEANVSLISTFLITLHDYMHPEHQEAAIASLSPFLQGPQFPGKRVAEILGALAFLDKSLWGKFICYAFAPLNNLSTFGLISGFINTEELRLKVLDALNDKLKRWQEEKETGVLACALGREILVHEDLFRLGEHPLLQTAIDATTAYDVNNPQNPWNVYGYVQIMQKAVPPAIDLPQEEIEGATLQLVPQGIRDITKGVKRWKFEELPVVKSPKELFDDFKDRISAIPGQMDKVVVRTGSTFDVLRASFVDDGAIQGFTRRGDPGDFAPQENAYFSKILEYIGAQDNVKEDSYGFTQREVALMHMAKLIDECSTGRGEKVGPVYTSLPKEHKFPDVSKAETNDEEKTRKWLAERVNALLEELLSPTNTALLGELTEPQPGETIDPMHQVRFVKNLTAHILGLKHELKFDPYTGGYLSTRLYQRSLKEILEIIYKHFTPLYLVNGLKRNLDALCTSAANNEEDKKLFDTLYDIFKGRGVESDEEWQLNDDMDRITEVKLLGARNIAQAYGLVSVPSKGDNLF